MPKFQNMENSNSRTFQGLFRDFQGPTLFSMTFKGLEFFSKIQRLSRTSQGPYEPCKHISTVRLYSAIHAGKYISQKTN